MGNHMRRLLPACLFALVLALTWEPVAAGSAVGPSPQAGQAQGRPSVSAAAGVAVPRNRIDELVFANLKRLGIQPAPLCTDAVFVRRAYLDVIGTLPTAQEAWAFISDKDPEKRTKLVDGLLERPEYADYWAMRWADLLRVKSEFPINLWPNAVQAYHHWIRTAIRDNVPYDQFVRDLLTASGSNFRVPPVNFYRALQSREPQGVAQAVALTFMGARAETWPKERLSGMAAFFSRIGYKPTGEWKEEIVFFDPDKKAPDSNAAAAPLFATFPDGTAARLAPDQDPREAFAAWLTGPKNPWLARAVANRAWFWFLGRGIVQEPDDIRPDNPPSDPDLLDFLERDLVASHFDLKHLYRLILNSATYQLSSIPVSDRPEAANALAFYVLRPLDAEVMVDAVVQITGVPDQYSSPIPEPFTFIPPDVRAIALADGSISSTFLETFGRPPRDTGRALERPDRPTAAQRLYLLNSSDVQRKLQQSRKLQALIQGVADETQVVNRLYLTILSRVATTDETRVAVEYIRAAENRRIGGLDLAWALLNSAEFRYRH
jgi:hypothetical protein